MILQLKIAIKELEQEIFRTILVNEMMTFEHLNELIQLLFQCEHAESYMFTIETSNSELEFDTNIGFDFNEDFIENDEAILDDEDELLSDWFLQEEDEASYTFVSNPQIIFTITLEKKLKSNEDYSTPSCIAAKGVLPGTDTQTQNVEPELLIAELNTLIQEFALLFDDSDFIFDWEKAFSTANDLNKLKPWNYLDENQIFVIQDPLTEEFMYCSVIGAGGQEFGLVVYFGDDGRESLEQLYSENFLPEDYFLSLSSLNVYFSNRDELDDMDYKLIKDNGLTFRGKKNWIQFRSYEPGLYPWIPDNIDMTCLQTAMEQTIAVVKQIQNGWEFPQFEDPNTYILRHLESDEGVIYWTQHIAEIEKINNADAELELNLSEFEIAKLKRVPKSTQELEFDMFYMSKAIQETPGERPIFPLFTGVIDTMSGMMIYQDFIPDKKSAGLAQVIFLGIISGMEARPKAVHVTKEMETFLAPIAKVLDIKLINHKYLTEMENFKNFLEQSEI